MVQRIHTEDVHLDVFSDRAKPHYAKYKLGIEELPPTFASDVDEEQRALEESMTTLVGAKRPEHYIELAKKRLADEASRSLQLPESFWSSQLPLTPTKSLCRPSSKASH